ncbi:sperm-associated antigen 7-like [Acanthaster planci]|uniref:Sperm-associated antigen 7-like n=1 Tax=Acanthaster planci TaxID=133434 RepID=A0A8B7YA76_ACAPL|nr:sperm-associated antigen 7-like [Acanthaster planci]
MADLLGSILGSMEKPPSVGDKEKKQAQERKKRLEKLQTEEKKKKNEFRERIEKEVNEFINDSSRTRLRYEPMERIYRSIVHDVAEVAGLTSFSFGEMDDNRFIILFKKEFAPTDDELDAYRRGETWDAEKAKELAKQKLLAEEDQRRHQASNPHVFTPASNYRDKYKSIIGEESAKDAAKNLTPNKQFGNVPSENKMDKRSVEETLDAIRQKKKQKIGEQAASTSQDR